MHIHTRSHSHTSHLIVLTLLGSPSSVDMDLLQIARLLPCYSQCTPKHYHSSTSSNKGIGTEQLALMQQIYSSLISHRVEGSSTPTLKKKMLHWS